MGCKVAKEQIKDPQLKDKSPVKILTMKKSPSVPSPEPKITKSTVPHIDEEELFKNPKNTDIGIRNMINKIREKELNNENDMIMFPYFYYAAFILKHSKKVNASLQIPNPKERQQIYEKQAFEQAAVFYGKQSQALATVIEIQLLDYHYQQDEHTLDLLKQLIEIRELHRQKDLPGVGIAYALAVINGCQNQHYFEEDILKDYMIQAINILEPRLEDYLYVFINMLEKLNKASKMYSIKDEVFLACENAMPRLERIKLERNYQCSKIPWVRFMYECYHKEYNPMLQRAIDATRKATGRKLGETSRTLSRSPSASPSKYGEMSTLGISQIGMSSRMSSMNNLLSVSQRGEYNMSTMSRNDSQFE